MSAQYRQNAAVIVTNTEGQVLLCARSFHDVPSTIQTVQGGIDAGETPREAAERELMEELGVAKEDFEIIDALEKTFVYEWSGKYLAESQERYPNESYIGQEQHFFLAMMNTDAKMQLDAHKREFDRVWWGTPQELLEGIWEQKRAGTEAALKAFGLLPAESST